MAKRVSKSRVHWRAVAGLLAALALLITACSTPAAPAATQPPAKPAATTAPAAPAAPTAAAPAPTKPAATAAPTAIAYPTKGIELVIPSSPGGASDVVGRVLADYLTARWKQPISVVNKPAASGTTATVDLLKSAPDGYSMSIFGNTHATTNPAVESNLPYKWTDPTLIGRMCVNPMVVIVPAKSPWMTLKDMLDAVAKDPTKYTYGTQSPAGPSTMGTYKLLKGAGIDPAKPAKVVFGGGAPTVTGVAGGNADWSVNSISEVQSLIESGNLRGLAVSGIDVRAKQIPNVPLMKEAGAPWNNYLAYTGLWGPSKLPDAIVQKWVEAIKEAQTDPAFVAKMDTIGAYPGFLDPAATKAYLQAEYDEAVRIVNDLGLKN